MLEEVDHSAGGVEEESRRKGICVVNASGEEISMERLSSFSVNDLRSEVPGRERMS